MPAVAESALPNSNIVDMPFSKFYFQNNGYSPRFSFDAQPTKPAPRLGLLRLCLVLRPARDLEPAQRPPRAHTANPMADAVKRLHLVPKRWSSRSARASLSRQSLADRLQGAVGHFLGACSLLDSVSLSSSVK
jgi:hypothetical protein